MLEQKWFSTAVAAAIISGAVVFAPSGAVAQQSCNNQTLNTCTATCGDAGVNSCTRSGSSVNCLCNSDTKDVNGNAFGTATQESEEGQGNLKPKTTGQDGGTTYPIEECTGNQGQCKKQ